MSERSELQATQPDGCPAAKRRMSHLPDRREG
jgi:hypothetical protein